MDISTALFQICATCGRVLVVYQLGDAPINIVFKEEALRRGIALLLAKKSY